MASRSSADDPMDLGPFLQNYVMKNPFRAAQQQLLSGADGLAAAGDHRPAGGGGRAVPPPRWTMRPRRRGANGAIGGRVTMDTSDRLLGNDDTGSHGDDDVTAW